MAKPLNSVSINSHFAFALYIALFVLNLSQPLQLLAQGKAYDKKAFEKYYRSKEFESKLNKHCNFETNYVASYKIKVSSSQQAEKILKKVSNFSEKHTWNKEIDAKSSYLLKKGNPDIGTIYHFEQTKVYSPLLPIPPTKNVYDYYIDKKTAKRFKGCVVYSSLPLQYANFEYKWVQENNKDYIQRTAKVIPRNLFLPEVVIKKKLYDSNKKALEKTVKNILGTKT